MNNWIFVGVIVGLLIVGGIAAVSAISTSSGADNNPATTCSKCDGTCSSEKNCGLAICGAVSGGSCGCNKR